MMILRKMTVLCAVIMGFIAIFAGCSNILPSSHILYRYSLEYDSPQHMDKTPLPLVLHVERFQASPLIDSTKIVYRPSAYEQNAYLYHKWWAKPGEMAAYFLARDFRESGLFKAVSIYHRTIPSSYIVEGIVEQWHERDDGDSGKAILALNITLIHADESDPIKRIIFQKDYLSEKTCSPDSPKSLAQAMSNAMAELSEAIIKNIYECIVTDRANHVK